jgi:hypothetical protein
MNSNTHPPRFGCRRKGLLLTLNYVIEFSTKNYQQKNAEKKILGKKKCERS